MPLPPFTPAAPANIGDAFDHDDYIFELKMDGFRAIAHVGQDQTRLVSRRGNVYKRFTQLAAAIHIELDGEAVLDGEIVCLGAKGRAQFYDLLRRRGTPVFYAFDLLWLDGEDLRSRPLFERKRLLRLIVGHAVRQAHRADRADLSGGVCDCKPFDRAFSGRYSLDATLDFVDTW